MKVLYILHSTLTEGGATKAVLGLVKELETKGVTPVFVVPDKDGIYSKLLEFGYEVYAIPLRMSIYPSLGGAKNAVLYFPRLIYTVIINLLSLYRIRKLVRKIKPSVIHSNTSVLNVGRIVANKEGIPHVQHIREYGELDFSMRYLPSFKSVHKDMGKNNAYNICITRDILKHHGFEHMPNAGVIYDGVHMKVDVMPRKKKQNYFLYAGRIEYGKGLDILLKSYREYKDRTVSPMRLNVAGGVSDESYYREICDYITDKELEEYVSFLGVVDNIELLMQESKALIIPSRSEGFGFCMPEAMFNGCLCIGYNTAGTKEQIDNGFKFTSGDIALHYNTLEELTEKLLEVHDNCETRWEAMKIRAFNTVNKFYTHTSSAESVYKIYQNVIQANK